MKQLVVKFVLDGYEVFFPNHFRFFGSNPVSDKASVVLGLAVVLTVVSEDVLGRDVADEMEKVFWHSLPTTSRTGGSKTLEGATQRGRNGCSAMQLRRLPACLMEARQADALISGPQPLHGELYLAAG